MSEERFITAGTLSRRPLPQPGADGDKERRGRVLVVGGCTAVPGGVLLAGTAALRAGAGKLQMAVPRSVAIPLGLAVPEALVIGLPEDEEGGIADAAAGLLGKRIGLCSAVLIGPGMMDGPCVAGLTTALLERLEPGPCVVLDAAALTALHDSGHDDSSHDSGADCLRPHRGRVVLTPHAGEMAGLLGCTRAAVEADPLAAARRAAARFQAVVAMKGGTTHVVTPQGDCWSYHEGSVGLATGGSGDTLAGITAGLLARGAIPLDAAMWAVWLHGEAGNRLSRSRGPLGFLARELLAEIPSAMILPDLSA